MVAAFLPPGVNRPGEILKPVGIVVHETATPGATAQNIRDYFAGHPDAEASAHYAIDANTCVQMIPDNEVAWHAGPTANHRYLSVEMCHFDNPDMFNQIWKNTVDFLVGICKKYGWTTANIFSHDWVSKTFRETNHTDPVGYFAQHGKNWTQFLADVQAGLTGGKPKMDQQDAQKIIQLLQAVWGILPRGNGTDEIHRLANAVRRAAGMPEQEG